MVDVADRHQLRAASQDIAAGNRGERRPVGGKSDGESDESPGMVDHDTVARRR